jgi:hypothetical protein
VSLVLPDALASLPREQVTELACRAHLGVWTEVKRKLRMTPLHWEWTELAMRERRLCVIAPREHGKTETFTVNHLTWRVTYTPGIWCYVFSQTDEQSKELLQKIVDTVEQTAPWLLHRVRQKNALRVRFANGARINAAGAGKAIRGPHPDLIVGDDVLEEKYCLTELMRKRTERWWKGSVGGMAHAGTTRWVRRFPGAPFEPVEIPPTRIMLVGTPFHEQDLLNGMKGNSMYRFRRYAAEYRPIDLVPGSLAVEAS